MAGKPFPQKGKAEDKKVRRSRRSWLESHSHKRNKRGTVEMTDAKELIKRHEGLRLKPYLCTAGKLTIAWGRNLDDRGISQAEAEIMLDNDLINVRKDLLFVFGDRVHGFSGNRLAALTDMMFNLGLTRFLKFKDMIEAIRQNNWLEAHKQALDSAWAGQVGQRAVEDAKLML